MNARASRLTPAGTAGVATIAISGLDAWPVIAELWNKPIEPPKMGSLLFGRFGEPPGDEVVLATLPGHWEIHCHGGIQVVEWLLELLTKRGVAIVDWTTFEGGPKIDAWARQALSEAMTLRTADLLLTQVNGAFRRAIDTICLNLKRDEFDAAAQRLTELDSFSEFGCHLTKPWRVAVCGPPNVGKSSLINTMAGYERAIVSSIPGTTRDVTTTLVALDGWPIELLDTAGVRDTGERLERSGIALGLEAAWQADLVLWVMDGSQPEAEPPLPPLLKGGSQSKTALNVVNKTDLPAAWEVPAEMAAIKISARERIGIDELIRRIVQALVPQLPAASAAIPFKDELVDTIRRAIAVLPNRPHELLAILSGLLGPADSA